MLTQSHQATLALPPAATECNAIPEFTLPMTCGEMIVALNRIAGNKHNTNGLRKDARRCRKMLGRREYRKEVRGGTLETNEAAE